MPKFRVLERSFIHDRIVEPGTIVDWDGDEVGSNLEPYKGKKREGDMVPLEESDDDVAA